jgi:two-component system sensor histidine kinase KdpD
MMAIPIPDSDTASARLGGYLSAVLLVAAATLVGLLIAPSRGTSAIDLLYLPAVLVAAVVAGRRAALFAAVGSALAYNYFFTAPFFTLHVNDPNDLLTIVVLFAVAVVTSWLAGSVRAQAHRADANAARNATIAGFARHLLGCSAEDEIAAAAVEQLAALFDCNALLVDDVDGGRLMAAAPAMTSLTPADLAVVALVLGNGERAGRGVERAVPTEWQFHPVRSDHAVIAAIGLARDDGVPPVRQEQLPLLDSLLDQVALALERSRYELAARAVGEERERDRLRSMLLSTIGQDLGPPIGAIAGAVSGLRREGKADKALLGTVAAETVKVERYLGNLLHLTTASDQRPVIVGDVTIDLFHRTVIRDGETVHLAPKEYAVLAELAKHPGRVMSHDHLLRTAWGPAQATQVDYLRVAVRGLRRKLEQDPTAPRIILNEPAVGYRLVAA